MLLYVGTRITLTVENLLLFLENKNKNTARNSIKNYFNEISSTTIAVSFIYWYSHDVGRGGGVRMRSL